MRRHVKRPRRRSAEVSAEILQAITEADLDIILDRIAEVARELCGSDLSAIALHDSTTDEMVFRHRSGVRALTGRRLVVRSGRGAGGHVLATGRPFRSDDLRRDPRVTGDPTYMHAVLAERIVTVLCVPIRIGGRIAGLLYVDNRAPRPFTRHDERRLRHLAAHAAVAIHDAQLRDDHRAVDPRCLVCGKAVTTDALVVFRHGELIHHACRPDGTRPLRGDQRLPRR